MMTRSDQGQPADGERLAFMALYDATVARAYGLALVVLRDPRHATAAVEEAYLVLWSDRASAQATESAAVAWLMSTVHRCAVRRLRSTGAVMASGHDDHAAGRGPEDGPMGELPSTQQRAIDLAYFAGLTHTEVEQARGLPAGTGCLLLRDELMRMNPTAAAAAGEPR